MDDRATYVGIFLQRKLKDVGEVVMPESVIKHCDSETLPQPQQPPLPLPLPSPVGGSTSWGLETTVLDSCGGDKPATVLKRFSAPSPASLSRTKALHPPQPQPPRYIVDEQNETRGKGKLWGSRGMAGEISNEEQKVKEESKICRGGHAGSTTKSRSAQESSALFWEEAQSIGLDTFSGGASGGSGDIDVGNHQEKRCGGLSLQVCGPGQFSSRVPGLDEVKQAGQQHMLGRESDEAGLERRHVGGSIAMGRKSRGKATVRSGKHQRKLLTIEEGNVSLGHVLRTTGGLLLKGGSKVSAVGKHITTLDGVPPSVFPETVSLFLSNNSLASLHGLGSFQKLCVLGLADNLLRYVSDLEPLSSLPLLEALSLRGNPVRWMPNYRAHVVSLLPGLRELDGAEVGCGE
ncbi:unnamed protein product [Choristocarpus tenellus]